MSRLGIVLTLGGMGRKERIRSQKVIQFGFKNPTARRNAISTIRNGAAKVTVMLSPGKALLPLLLLLLGNWFERNHRIERQTETETHVCKSSIKGVASKSLIDTGSSDDFIGTFNRLLNRNRCHRK